MGTLLLSRLSSHHSFNSILQAGLKPGAAALYRPLWAAFDLDASCTCGKVALFYVVSDSDPQVWFQDLGCHWHFLAASYADFFRFVTVAAFPLLLLFLPRTHHDLIAGCL
jgi:hypothetical protein